MTKHPMFKISLEREDGAKAHFWVSCVDTIFNEEWYNSKMVDVGKPPSPTPKSMKDRINEMLERSISIPQ